MMSGDYTRISNVKRRHLSVLSSDEKMGIYQLATDGKTCLHDIALKFAVKISTV